jgi:hypothetical protein
LCIHSRAAALHTKEECHKAEEKNNVIHTGGFVLINCRQI